MKLFALVGFVVTKLLITKSTKYFQNDSLISISVAALTYPEAVDRVGCVLDTYYTNKIWCLGGFSNIASVYSFDGISFNTETPLGLGMYQYDGGITIVKGTQTHNALFFE